MDARKEKIFECSLEACIGNGARLLEDAELLFNMDRHASAVALSILAEEEFAKAFLLRLVIEEAVPWTTEVRRSLSDHSSKHLLGLVVDWLSTLLGEFWEELERLDARRKNGEPATVVDKVPWPGEVADALNLYRFEKLDNWRSGYRAYIAEEDFPESKDTLRKVIAHDRKKQNAFYVGFGSDGQCCNKPEQITMEEAKAELERGKRFSRFAGDHLRGSLSLFSPEYRHLAAVIKAVFAALAKVEERLTSTPLSS
jgi:AbiV family abortive infection protein